MNKLNQLGSEILNHKIEYNKNYPEIIKNALFEAVKVKLGEIHFEKISDYLSNVDVDIEEFKLTLFSIGTPFCKTKEELRGEFQKSLDSIISVLGWSNVSSEIDMEKEKLVVIKPYLLPDNFAKEYFGVADKDVFKFMAKDGIVGKFAFLRLPAIFKNIFSEIEYNGDRYSLSTSPTYFHEDKNTYGIDLFVSFDIEDVLEKERENTLSALLEEVTSVGELLNSGYAKRIVC